MTESSNEKNRTGKILIVDDEEPIRLALRELIKKEGYDAYIVQDGDEAVLLSQNHRFDLVFMDMIMPGMNGLETFKKIKEIQPDVKAVLMTGYIEDAEKFLLKAIEEGMIEEYLRKPFYNEEIIDIVHKYAKD